VPFNVTLPPTAAVPESVTAVLRIGGATWASGKWPKSQWTSGQTRRIAVAFDAVTLATGVYAYTLEVTNWYLAPTAPQVTTVNNEMIIVNRSASPFGAGWWVAGGCSQSLYHPVGPYTRSTTRRPATARPDS